MRITQRSMQFGVSSNLQAALSRLQRLQEQLSSGKLVAKPSDSPTSAVSALRFRADIRRGEQLKRNADDAVGRLNIADRALTDQLELVNRARQLALQGKNDASGPDARDALAQEVEQLRSSALAIANTTYLGHPVFGGTTANSSAYDQPTGAYLGTTAAVERTVAPNASVQISVTGPDAFGPAGADLFTVLDDIATSLRTDPTQLGANLDALDAVFGQITNAVATIGARTHQVEGLQDRVSAGVLQATNGLSEVESIDLPDTIVKLQLQETAYQAALSATSRMIQPSLVDFLR